MAEKFLNGILNGIFPLENPRSSSFIVRTSNDPSPIKFAFNRMQVLEQFLEFNEKVERFITKAGLSELVRTRSTV